MWPDLYFKRIILSVCAEDGSEEDKIENKNELEGCYTNLSKKMMGARKNTMAVRIEISEQIWAITNR